MIPEPEHLRRHARHTVDTSIGGLSPVRRATSKPSVFRYHVLLLGYGNIGQAVARCLEAERDRLRACGLVIEPARALVRDLTKRRGGPAVDLSADRADVIDDQVDVVIEALGGLEPARALVTAALRAGLPVVSANKTLLATHGPELRAIAAAHGARLAYDAAVLAGVPFVGSLARRPLVSAVRRVEAILNGTSHFVISAMTRGASPEVAMAHAIARGYAEPDSAADLNGRDAAEKLTILLHLAGRDDVRVEHLPRLGLDVLDVKDFPAARQLGGAVKPVALAALDERAPGAWVGPAFVADDHPFARLEGVTNALRIQHATGWCTFSGPGAGPAVTATTIVDDVVEVLTGAAIVAPPHLPVNESRNPPALTAPPASSWFLRLSGARVPAVADLAEYFAVRRTPIVRLAEREGRLVCVTAPAPFATIAAAVQAVRACGVEALVLPVLDGGRGE